MWRRRRSSSVVRFVRCTFSFFGLTVALYRSAASCSMAACGASSGDLPHAPVKAAKGVWSKPPRGSVLRAWRHGPLPRGSAAPLVPSVEEISGHEDLKANLHTTCHLSCSGRKRCKQNEHEERKKMRIQDKRSALVGLLIAARARAPDEPAAVPASNPQFRPGQSVLQWWASWFKSIPEGALPEHYGGKSRPTWFSGEVTSYAGCLSIIYAGRRHTGHCYDAY